MAQSEKGGGGGGGIGFTFPTKVSILLILHVWIHESDEHANDVATESAYCEGLVAERVRRELGRDGPRNRGPALSESGKPDENCEDKVLV